MKQTILESVATQQKTLAFPLIIDLDLPKKNYPVNDIKAQLGLISKIPFFHH